MDYMFIFYILASIGGFTGIINLYNWIKSKKAKVKIQFPKGNFYCYQDDLIVHSKIQLSNERDEAVYVTDIIALITEDPSKTKDKEGRSFTMRPTNPVFSPSKIEAKGTIDLDFEINFSKIDVHLIERTVNYAKFCADDVVCYDLDKKAFIKKWDDLPLIMKLFIHINGKELIDTFVRVFPRSTTDSSFGTLDLFQIGKLQRDNVILLRDYFSESQNNK
jgi:hypothetical protein